MKKLSKKQFVTVVENIHNTVNYAFDSKHCEAFGVLIDKELNVQIEKIDSSSDIYDMLDTDNDELLSQINNYDMISFATNGWAAPVAKDDDEYSDLPPSQHPQKRRVRLLSSANIHDQVGSSILFSDDIDSPVYDYGDARGTMATAIIELMDKAKDLQVK
jgi:hypothetical protein